MNTIKKILFCLVFLMIFLLIYSVKRTFSQYPQLFKGPRKAGSAIDGSIADACAADVDNDGDLDLVTVYPEGPELAICYNDGYASFSPPWYVNENVGTADLVQSVAVGDLDGDGYTDLVSATWNGFFAISGDENSVAINLNAGDGTFIEAVMIPVLDRTTEVITGDFDNDNDIDIAATHKDTSRLSILLNNGDATFTPFQDYEIGEGAWTLYCAEITSDGFLDIIVATTSGELNLLINNGDGSFTVDKLTLAPGLQNVHGGDVDEDGDIDLITINSTTNIVNLFSNDGNGIFTEAGSYTMNHWINSVCLSDFTGDGHLDFCVANYDTSTISLFVGNGTFSFTEVNQWLIGSSPHDVFAADLNSDGAQDIISCTNNLWAVAILNKGDGTFEVLDHIFNVDPEPIAIDAADFNGDGFQDLILYHKSWTTNFPVDEFITVSFNDGFGNFLTSSRIGGKSVDNDHPLDSGNPFTISDFDNDGDIDLAAAMTASALQGYPLFFKIFLNDGIGNFNRIENRYEVPEYTFNEINFMNSTDIDQDSDLDIIVTWGNNDSWGPTGFSVFYNDGLANFDSVYCDTLFTQYNSAPTGLLVADFTNNNFPDIIVAIPPQYGRTNIVHIKNLGNGLFDIPVIIKSELYALSGLFSSDFNGDSNIDIGMVYSTSALVKTKGKVLLNNGDGTFTSGSNLSFPGQSPSWAEACDIDKDGDIDVIGCTSWDELITVNINDGDGLFDKITALQFLVFDRPTSLVLTDVDNNGFDDVATVSDNSLSILMNALDQPVPVELFSFQANVKENSVRLDWSTASETNNYGFEIERSGDDKIYNKIGFVRGSGTNNNLQSYSFIDHNITAGTYFYRLKQLNSDGSFKYSEVIQVTVGIPGSFRLSQNYPNPFNPETIIKYQLAKAAKIRLELYNLLGQKVVTLVNKQQLAGYYSIVWDGKNGHGEPVASGIYLYRFQTDDFVEVKKLTLLR